MGVGPSAAYILPTALKDVQFYIAARPGQCHPGLVGARPGASSQRPEVQGRWPKTLERLGFRPAGTSLMSLGRTTSCRIASVGHSLTRCTRPWRSEHVG